MSLNKRLIALKSDIKNKQKIYTYPQVNLIGKLTTDQILDIIEDHSVFVSKYEENQNYYIGANKVKPASNDNEAPNNEITVPYARTLVNTVKGYMYKPGLIKYIYDGDNDAYFNQIKDIFDINKEPQKNSELGEHQSKYGIGFEILYLKLDEDKTKPYFSWVDPREVIPIYDYSIERNLICAIRYYNIDNDDEKVTIKKRVEVYYKNRIEYYILEINGDGSKLYAETENTLDIEGKSVPKMSSNFFLDIPLVIYKNNEECSSDYEPVATMINLYDKLMSDSANELDRFAAAYMLFKNYVIAGNAEEQKQKMNMLKQMRAFFVNGDGDISFLTKDIPTAFIQEVKNTLREDIVYHTQIPDFRDKEFGTASGIAIRYKLINFENLCASKEAYFKDGLYRRIQLINNFLKIQADSTDLKEIDIKFTRNIPENVLEQADIAIKLKDIISQETLLDQLSIIDDVESELERIEKEKEEAKKQFDIENINTIDESNTDNQDMQNTNMQKEDISNEKPKEDMTKE